jgi:hypothetical protein
MFGLFGRFGRSRELRHLDDELRTAGVHPVTVTDAVKLTIIRLLKTAHGDAAPHFAEAASLVAYCMLGPGPYADINGAHLTEAVEHRLHKAVAEENSLDAQIVLLTMHANLIRSEVVERFGLNIDA